MNAWHTVRHAAVEDQARLLSAHPGWNPDQDARSTALGKLINVMTCTQLALAFETCCLIRHDWWEANIVGMPSIDARGYWVSEFPEFIKVSFLNSLFVSVESTCRVLLRAIDPTACGGGTAAFQSIHRCLFGQLSTTPADGADLLELLRLVRNTCHHNGVFLPTPPRDVQIIYKGTTYDFRCGQAVEGMTWEFMVDRADDLHHLMVAIVNDRAISGISKEIRDPALPR
jgi:hypothetical protein